MIGTGKNPNVAASVVIGIDLLLGKEEFYLHTWVNLFPYSVGLTDKAYEGDEMQYDLGLQIGTQLSEHIGVFIEGMQLNYYGREEYNISTGINLYKENNWLIGFDYNYTNWDNYRLFNNISK